MFGFEGFGLFAFGFPTATDTTSQQVADYVFHAVMMSR